MNNKTLTTAALLGALAVVLGAFGAHGLEGRIDDDMLAAWKTGVFYHFIHVLALLIAGLIPVSSRALSRRKWAGRLWLTGICLFSGSLYLMSLAQLSAKDWSFLGAITPLGGLSLIGGWLFFAFSLSADKSQ